MSDQIDIAKLDDTQSEALMRLILTLADSKRLMGIRYSDWLLGAPSIETGIAASAMCQDEWGHARLLYAMLKGFGVDPVPVEHDREPAAYASISVLDEPLPNWPALIAAMVVVDGAITSVLRSFAGGTFEPASNRVPKMLAEEEFHASLGAAWFKRLAEASDESRALLVEATEGMLPACLAWVGASDSAAEALVALGVTGSADDRVADFKAALEPVLAHADIGFGEPSTDWDEGRGRASGQPDDDSVARARGDLNRALFVE